jgi:DNA-binding IclR family transcriptional regulator
MPRTKEPSNSLVKMLNILDLFTIEDSIWATNDLLDAMSLSRSTGYRYIRALTSAGLLSAVGNGYYVLGPRIIELDLQIRGTDPLLKASDGVLEELTRVTGQSALLCTLFQNSVLCVKKELVALSPTGLIDRGQRRPLFRGAMSRIILAHLSPHRLRTIFNKRHAEIVASGMGQEWAEFRTKMSTVRSDGYDMSAGQFTKNLAGCGAPIFNSDDEIIGSVGVAWHLKEQNHIDRDKIIVSVKRAGREISDRMAASGKEQVLRPRAVG